MKTELLLSGKIIIIIIIIIVAFVLIKIAGKARTPGDGADHNKERKALSTTNCEESEVQLILVLVSIYVCMPAHQ